METFVYEFFKLLLIIFSTSQNFAFKVLPPIIPEFADTAEDYRNYFTGNPETILFNKSKEEDGEGGGAPVDDQQQKQEVDSLADSEDLEEASK